MSVCRGCGGTGVGQHVSQRIAQIAARAYTVKRPPTSSTTRPKPRILKLGPRDTPRPTAVVRLQLPLAEMVDRVAELETQGFDVSGVPWRKEWACDWCHGTGEPQLSAATLRMAVKR